MTRCLEKLFLGKWKQTNTSDVSQSKKHEDIFSIFSLKDIASFLNITPTYLSRLRNAKHSREGL